MEFSLADIIPYLTERGRVEVDLALARTQNARQVEIINLLQEALDAKTSDSPADALPADQTSVDEQTKPCGCSE